MARRSLIYAAVLVAVLALPAGTHARVPAGFVGMASEELGGVFTSDSYRAQALAAQRRAGVRLLRQTFEWAYIERPPGGTYPLPQFDWSVQDRLVLAAARSGISVLPVLFNPPAFHSSRPSGSTDKSTHPPRDPASMAAFASAAVARYGPGGSLWRENPGVPVRPIRAWQVWNEPTLPASEGRAPAPT